VAVHWKAPSQVPVFRNLTCRVAPKRFISLLARRVIELACNQARDARLQVNWPPRSQQRFCAREFNLRVLEILYIKTRKKMENVRVEIPHPLVIRWLVTLHS
jgi:hypothetical protein